MSATVAERAWTRNTTPPGAWEAVALKLKTSPKGTLVELWWYGPRTAPNGPWMRDKCRRLGLRKIIITHAVDERSGEKKIWLSLK